MKSRRLRSGGISAEGGKQSKEGRAIGFVLVLLGRLTNWRTLSRTVLRSGDSRDGCVSGSRSASRLGSRFRKKGTHVSLLFVSSANELRKQSYQRVHRSLASAVQRRLKMWRVERANPFWPWTKILAIGERGVVRTVNPASVRHWKIHCQLLIPALERTTHSSLPLLDAGFIPELPSPT